SSARSAPSSPGVRRVTGASPTRPPNAATRRSVPSPQTSRGASISSPTAEHSRRGRATDARTAPPTLATALRQWGPIGCIGFGGPPTHIRLLRDLCVERERWLTPVQFEDALAACNLLPGPASTQLAIFCGWRVRGSRGAVLGGAAFVVPGLIVIL